MRVTSHGFTGSSDVNQVCAIISCQNDGKFLQRAYQRLEGAENNAHCFRHYSRTRQMSPINTLTVSNAAASDRRHTWVQTHPRSKSSVREDNCAESFEVRFGIKDFTIVLEDLMKSRAIKERRKFKFVEQSDYGQHLKSAIISGSDLDQNHGFIVDENDCNKTVLKAVQECLPMKGPSPLSITRGEQTLMKSTQTVQKRRQKRSPLQLCREREAPLYHLISWKHGQNCLSSPDIFKKDFLNVKSKVTSTNELDPHNLNSALPSEECSSLSVTSRAVQEQSSDDEQEPMIDVGMDENGMYEVERILARKKLQNGTWLYYIKWAGWPYKRSSWQARNTFGNMSEAIQEFYARERALSVVVRREQQWSQLKEISQLHSLIRWENEINTILQAKGQQILYIHNDVDYARRRRNFTYITANKWSAEAKACMNMSNYTPIRCTCPAEKCGGGKNCCPMIEKSKFFYTKRRQIRSCFYKSSGEYVIVECYGCRCSSDCPTKVIQNGRRYKVAIVRTETRGWGVFTLEDIPSNVFVMEYIGEVLTITEGDSRRDSTYQFELNGYSEIKYLIDAKYYGNEAAFVNHSCDPNLVAVRVRVERFDQSFHRIGLFSMCRISRGQELTLNYFGEKWGPETMLTSEEGTVECSCGALNCMRYWPELAGNTVDNGLSDEDNKENSSSNWSSEYV
ncbi:hypothetical protein LOAG_18944 [Loa loa]|uniref:Histone-lysine N-methyltransferase n=1 Tax=Loa loa TaxID=7209 RepID=A0A1I7VB98_LOALO|nr:hypothetical protein LOAG_18944 [Loa loa]EJD73642.1 hypothetical protein LOAG_18944 [Loa loa]